MINIINSEYSLFVSKINLISTQLEKEVKLTIEEKNRYAIFTNEKRKIEWLGTRYLLQTQHNKQAIIIYNNDGKPTLNSGENISISHSNGVVGIIISNQDIGLDIERKREKIDRIKEKFLNKNELNEISNSTDKTTLLTTYWSCKEALLKIYGKTDLIFDEQLFVEINNNKITGKIITDKIDLSLNLNIEKIDDYIIVWGVTSL